MSQENPAPQIPLEIAREIARQGDQRLSALMNLATAADLRATTLCGIFGAAAVGITAAVLAVIASDHPSSKLISAGAVTAIGFFVAAIVDAFAGAPRDFYITGGSPDSLREWLWIGTDWRSEVELLDATAQRYAASIKRNREILDAGSRRVLTSLIVGVVSPILGTATFFAYRCVV